MASVSILSSCLKAQHKRDKVSSGYLFTGRGRRGKKKWQQEQWEATVRVRSEVKRARKRAEEVRATRPCVSACVCMRVHVC